MIHPHWVRVSVVTESLAGILPCERHPDDPVKDVVQIGNMRFYLRGIADQIVDDLEKWENHAPPS